MANTNAPRKSVVKIYFPSRNITLAHFNDKFDLHTGDKVYVEGKYEGVPGRVTEVSYNFKIKLADYKKVIALVDTEVKGQFYMAGSHFITFDSSALTAEKVRYWFMAPVNEEDIMVSGCDDSTFSLDNLNEMKVSPAIAERGHKYYMDNRVKYLSIDKNRGYAIVEGSENYEVEFTYTDGQIGNMLCNCYCSGNCKHEFATMLQLKDLLEVIADSYSAEYAASGYFAAMDKATLFATAIAGKEKGSFTL